MLPAPESSCWQHAVLAQRLSACCVCCREAVLAACRGAAQECRTRVRTLLPVGSSSISEPEVSPSTSSGLAGSPARNDSGTRCCAVWGRVHRGMAATSAFYTTSYSLAGAAVVRRAVKCGQCNVQVNMA